MAEDAIAEFVNRLARPHFEHLYARRQVRQQGQLTRLREAIGSSLGRTHAGHSALHERLPLNLPAFTLYEDLAGRIATLRESATGERAEGTPEQNLLAWHRTFDAAWLHGDVTTSQWIVALSHLGGWSRRIDALFQQPRIGELVAACPVTGCGARWHIDHDGTRRSALYTSYQPGGDVSASCRVCGASWIGEERLMVLAANIERLAA